MEPRSSDLLASEAWSGLTGSPLVFVDPNDGAGPGPGVRIAIDRTGTLPKFDPAHFDVLVTVAAKAPKPWVSVAPARLEAQLQEITRNASRAPIATVLLGRLLRVQQDLPYEAALEVESLAYSALLGGREFGRWRETSGQASSGEQAADPVRYDRDGDAVTLTLRSPGNRNAMTATMRDALYEALANVVEDPTRPSLSLRGEGRCFSTGGDLAEFGTARDLAAAHMIRTQRSCARVLHQLGRRATVHLHGACIGSGIEVAAAAARRIGATDTLIQLPELKMGLIPGAGGTVSIGRAIGRHRLMWLCLGAFRIGAGQALDWDLLHGIGP